MDNIPIYQDGMKPPYLTVPRETCCDNMNFHPELDEMSQRGGIWGYCHSCGAPLWRCGNCKKVLVEQFLVHADGDDEDSTVVTKCSCGDK